MHLLILLSLSNEVLYDFFEEKIASMLWLKLEKLFVAKSIYNKLLWKWHLFHLQIKESTPLQDHLDELNFVLLELHGIDVKLEDEDLAMILLAFLPTFVWECCEFSKCWKRLPHTWGSQVKSSLYSRKHWHKAFRNGDEVFSSRLSITNSAKG